MQNVPTAGDGSQGPALGISGRCPNHGPPAQVVITGGQEDAFQCRVSTCCSAFAEQIVRQVEG